ncbi:MAG TPA: carboxypeptidase-like regulatory domain-containing protein [Candidatus Limnocylindrales bacterium]|nr:carboxypeptidase-like regulatory domain-containing protein [Candidatus Limnocylindrales bacterium]
MPSLSNKTLALILAAAAAAFAQNGAGISGSVVNTVTGAPITHAHIAFRTAGGPATAAMEHPAITDDSGNFSIANLDAGEYFYSVSRTGFVENNRQQVGRLRLAAGEKREKLTVKMDPVGVITGRVLNPDGDPVEGATISIYVGSRRLNNAIGAQTDDRGEYRIGGLAPGRYRLRAATRELPLPPEIRTDGTREEHLAASWYAGTIVIGPGTEAAGTDIHMLAAPIVRVSGKVVGLGDRAFIQAYSSDGGNNAAQSHKDGTFDIWRLDPGHYTVTARAGQQSTVPVEIDVAAANVDGIELRYAEPVAFTITSIDADPAPQRSAAPQRQSARTGTAQTPPVARRMTASIVLRETGAMFSSQANQGDDGAFAFTKVVPAKYRITLLGNPGYVQSVKVGDAVVEEPTLDLRHYRPGTPVSITVSYKMASLAGKVTNAVEGTPLFVFVSQLTVDGPQVTRTAAVRPDGTYEITGLVPGKYQAVVIEQSDLQTVQSSGPPDSAETIELQPGENQKKDLQKPSSY